MCGDFLLPPGKEPAIGDVRFDQLVDRVHIVEGCGAYDGLTHRADPCARPRRHRGSA
jgi:hypothetical protein